MALKQVKKFGVAFDIDGVLTRTPNPIPGAKEALELLQSRGIPFCLMTNGGGGTEELKAKSVSKLLNLAEPLVEGQVCLSHTPMRSLDQNLKKKPVLLVGKHYSKLKEVAHSYGFAKAVTCDELHSALPHLYPDFDPYDPSYSSGNNRLSSAEEEGFGAVLAFTDPITWGRELQIVTDVLSAPNGNIHAVANPTPNIPTTVTQHVPFYNACADFTYAAKWPVARFGAGAFRVALEKLWSELSDEKLNQTVYGKPSKTQYQYVEEMLNEFENNKNVSTSISNSDSSIDRYYMVGDNPLTDIRGARGAGPHWKAVLTRSGLWRGEKGENDATDPAHVVVDDVLEGVRWILDQEKS